MNEITIKYENGKMTINTDLLKEWTISDFRYLCKSTLDISVNQKEAAAAIHKAIKELADELKERRNLDNRQKSTLKKLEKMLVTLETKYPEATEGKTEQAEKVRFSKGFYHILTTDNTGEKVLKKVTGFLFEIDGRTFGATNKTPDFTTLKYWSVTDVETGCSVGYSYKSKTAITDDVKRFHEIVTTINTKSADNVKEMKAVFDDLYKKMYGEQETEQKTEEEQKTTENVKEEKTMKETKYFENVKTLEELRTEYKNLLKENHPDNGGAVDVMQNINAQYDARFTELKSAAKIETKADTAKWSDVEDAAIRNAIAAIIGYPGLNIEIVGCWVWVDGNTYECKDDLKTAGYKWSRARKKWHFAPYEKKFYKGSKKSFEQLRREYGSTEIEENEKIA